MSEMELPDPRPYIRIAGLLRQQIFDGTFKPGESVPSITDMQREFRHSRQTISKALGLLVNEGLIFRTPGHPYTVANHQRDK